MMTSADKVDGWVKKGQNHDDVILEWSLNLSIFFNIKISRESFRSKKRFQHICIWQ